MLYLNGTPLDVTRFPDNTTQVWKLSEIFLAPSKDPISIKWEFTQEGEFLHLAQLKTLLDHHNIKASLTLTYLPYGRQDKDVSNGATFALHTFAKLINSLNFTTVSINDPHSNVVLDLINRSYPTYPIRDVIDVIELTKSDLLCYPDHGAVSKYQQIYDYPNIYGEKVRDQLTGNITNYKLIGDPKGKNVLIVDDICDGGMTFKLLTKDLLAAGANEVNLFVTHGIFSKGLRTLKDSGIKRVFTQDGEALKYQDQIMYRRLS